MASDARIDRHVSHLVDRLEADGHLVRDAAGCYTLTPRGRIYQKSLASARLYGDTMMGLTGP